MLNIDIINPASEYYNDICYTYTSKDGTDITLSDRKNIFVNDNLTVCEENCKFNGYNYTTGKVSCSCNAQINPISKISDIVFDKNKLYESFTDFKNIMNLNVFKCYKLRKNNLILYIMVLLFY